MRFYFIFSNAIQKQGNGEEALNNGSNGRNRNNRYSNGSRRPFSDDGNRRGYSQGTGSRYSEYDYHDSHSRGRYQGDYYSSSDYSRGRNQQYTDYTLSEYDSSDYYSSDNDSFDNYPSASNRNAGYPRGGSTNYPRGGSSDYSRGVNSGYPRNRNSDYARGGNSGYPRNRNSDYGRGGNSGYPRNRNSDYARGGNSGYLYDTNSVRSRQSTYRKEIENNEKLPVSVFIGIGVTTIAVITLIISISINSNRAKKRNQTYDDHLTSQSDVSGATIIDFSDDETNDSDNTIDSSQPVMQSFVGTWYKTDVTESKKSIFTVTMQYSDSFEFRLENWDGKESAVINGTAFYTDETHADYSPKKKIKITFERGADYVKITHTGSNSSFGIGSKFTIDGNFTEQMPEYTVESETSSEIISTVTYDYNIYQSDAVVKALSKTLNAEDYALYQDMMKNGLKSPIDYERTKDKNGRLVNVDAELNAVKYYAHLNSNGYDMIFICSDNANIYVLFYNSEEIIYYTNDKNYSSTMPTSFQAVAKAKDIKPTFR